MWEVDGAAAAARARRAGAAARAAPLLLEEREVGRRAARCSTTTSPASGSATATTTAATPGSSSATRATDRVTEPRRAERRGRPRRSSRSRDETPRAKTFRLALAEPDAAPRRPALRRPAHRARRLHRVALVLGRVAARRRRTRSSSPSSGSTDGEVSTFLHDVVEVGDELEVRGPIGGWFVWDGDTPGAARRRRLGRRAADGDAAPRARDRAHATSCGSSCRCARPTTSTTPTSCRARRRRSCTRAPRPPVPTRPPGRLTAADLAPLAARRRDRVRVRLGRLRRRREPTCSSSSACPVERIRVERFGPTG